MVSVADSSALVPALIPAHPDHVRCAEALATTTAAVAHALIETYATLTRLPDPARVPPPVAAELLTRRFPDPALALPGEQHRELLRALGAGSVRGAAAHDALIAATAKHGGARLITRDRRALPTYAAVGADVLLLD